jgi:hypothetical protein
MLKWVRAKAVGFHTDWTHTDVDESEVTWFDDNPYFINPLLPGTIIRGILHEVRPCWEVIGILEDIFGGLVKGYLGREFTGVNIVMIILDYVVANKVS